MKNLISIYTEIQKETESFQQSDFRLSSDHVENPLDIFMNEIFQKKSLGLNPHDTQRLRDEIFGYGPLEKIFETPDISEILVQSDQQIWIERGGKLSPLQDHFFCPQSYQKIFDRICKEAQTFVNLDRPFVSTSFKCFRLGLVHTCLVKTSPQMSFRRHPENPWNLQSLIEAGWCDVDSGDILKKIIREKKNFLVVGPTASGKTSVSNALLQMISKSERALLIEDTSELCLPNFISTKLLTRNPIESCLNEITQLDLLKYSLRLRPDRLIMGEIRGEEAKDFLLMIATGHGGSFGTLHGENAQQALMRLEMLIQMGAPQWSLETVRRLIHQCLQYLIVVKKNEDGRRQLEGIYALQSLESFGFTIVKVSLRQ